LQATDVLGKEMEETATVIWFWAYYCVGKFPPSFAVVFFLRHLSPRSDATYEEVFSVNDHEEHGYRIMGPPDAASSPESLSPNYNKHSGLKSSSFSNR
jgi:hypothetical protein